MVGATNWSYRSILRHAQKYTGTRVAIDTAIAELARVRKWCRGGRGEKKGWGAKRGHGYVLVSD